MNNDTDLRKRLTPEQYRITQGAGTEAPFTGPHLDEKRPGIYQCICCGASLFDSDAKYDSGSGWPSYTKPADPAAVTRHTDHKLLMTRTEIRCTKCDAHLGHVFADGPAPTGERYCINGHVLHFKAANDDSD